MPAQFFGSQRDFIRRLVEMWSWYFIKTSETPFSVPHPRLVPVHPLKKWTIVLDLDETLVHVDIPTYLRSKSVKDMTIEDLNEFTLYIRPGARELLEYLRSFPDLEIIIWTAGQRSHAERCCAIFGPENFDAAIARDEEKRKDFEWDLNKDLRILARDVHNNIIRKNIILIDNNPSVCKFNKDFSVINIEDFLLKSIKLVDGQYVSEDNALIGLKRDFYDLVSPDIQKILREKQTILPTPETLLPKSDIAVDDGRFSKTSSAYLSAVISDEKRAFQLPAAAAAGNSPEIEEDISQPALYARDVPVFAEKISKTSSREIPIVEDISQSMLYARDVPVFAEKTSKTSSREIPIVEDISQSTLYARDVPVFAEKTSKTSSKEIPIEEDNYPQFYPSIVAGNEGRSSRSSSVVGSFVVSQLEKTEDEKKSTNHSRSSSRASSVSSRVFDFFQGSSSGEPKSGRSNGELSSLPGFNLPTIEASMDCIFQEQDEYSMDKSSDVLSI